MLQGQVLVLGVGVRPGDLQDGRRAVAASYRQHQRAPAMHRVTVEGEIPLGQRLLDESWQMHQPVVSADVRLGVAAGHHGRELFWDKGAHV